MSDSHRRRIDLIEEGAFTDDLTEVEMDELRRRRRVCSDLDTELSYYRRLLHGRMDLLGFEVRKRSGEEERTLLEALPEILAGPASAGGGLPSRSISVDVPELPNVGRRSVDHILGDDFVVRLPDMEDAEIADLQSRVSEVEQEVSRQRRLVFEANELIQGEIARRYRDGLADIDELLRQS